MVKSKKDRNKSKFNKSADPFADVVDEEKREELENKEPAELVAGEDNDNRDLFEPQERGHRRSFTPDEKFTAIIFLESSLRQYQGELKPNFSRVARWLQIDRTNLMRWWKKRDEIKKQANHMAKEYDQMISHQLRIQMLRAVDELSRRDFAELTPKQLNKLLSTLSNKVRLFSNKSTSNVANQHKVTHKIAHVIPKKEEDQKEEDPDEG